MALTADQYRAEAESALTKGKTAAGNSSGPLASGWADIARGYISLYAQTKNEVTP
jgi:hypothetical protein